MHLIVLSFLFRFASCLSPRGIILIVMDDLGMNELGSYNNSRGLQTPNLDSLAKGGARLTSYYTNPLCSPTRSALMTGKYNHRLGLQSNVIYWDTPWSVPASERFLPQLLKDIPGFGTTGMFGKVRVVLLSGARFVFFLILTTTPPPPLPPPPPPTQPTPPPHTFL